MRLGPEAVVYRLLDAIVDAYDPVLRGLGIDREQIERQVFSGDPAAAARIYHLSREAVDLQHATASFGYPVAVALMVAFAAALYLIFKRAKWM